MDKLPLCICIGECFNKTKDNLCDRTNTCVFQLTKELLRKELSIAK